MKKQELKPFTLNIEESDISVRCDDGNNSITKTKTVQGGICTSQCQSVNLSHLTSSSDEDSTQAPPPEIELTNQMRSLFKEFKEL